jgi:hypothetical protein
MKRRMVPVMVSASLFNLLKQEKSRLKERERKKRSIRKNVITNWDASQSIVKKCLR